MHSVNKNTIQEIYKEQFNFAKNIVGDKILAVEYYLEESDTNFTEQPNEFGHSLFNGINIITDNQTFTIYNGFNNDHGLKMQKGRVSEFEFIEEEKIPTSIIWNILNERIIECNLYWMEIPWTNSTEFYPQEIEIITNKNKILISSIEINNGEVNTEFTSEILIIENSNIAENLKLGKFGIDTNGRFNFKKASEIN